MKLFISIIFFLIFLAPIHFSQDKILGGVFSNGGSVGENSVYRLSSTIGEIVIGKNSNSINSNSVGFWYILKDIITGLEEEDNLPEVFTLSQNYPNPFNPSTTIEFQIPERVKVNLILYDILGQEVVRLIDKEMDIGKYKILFNATNLSSGVYIYRIVAGEFISTKKMQLIK
jgi:hypothetical protein